ncbi:annexin-like protein RJ4 [Vigna unguiculata]|uniref:annexin-like protein RJ4 n=1 Tax=Vigna unguiculata TaxID=3917 RepID=UPI001015FE1B|nr:annexin-like protein RJ4 [Vigna unguiculata]
MRGNVHSHITHSQFQRVRKRFRVIPMATLVLHHQTSPAQDAEALHQAFKGWGSDGKAIIAILGHRNVHQRQEIRRAYEEIYQENLIKRLESEISGDFERAVYRWMLEPADRDAVLMNVAIKNGPKEYNVIAEIASVLSAKELLAVRCAYHDRYKRSLEEDVAAHTTGHLRQLLVGLVSSYRYEGDEINVKLAQTEANILHESIKEKKTNYEEVTRILTTRSKTQLVATFNRYRDEHGISISKKLVDQSSDDFVKVLHTVIRCVNDHKKYYEKVLRNAIKKFGTDEDGLTRVIVTRAEKDLKDIKEVYYKRNSVHLEDAVSKEISGDYKRFMLALLGNQD